MAIRYRFLIKLTSIREDSKSEMFRILLVNNRGTGRDHWHAVMEAVERGESPTVFQTNSVLEADRMMQVVVTHGGKAKLVDQTAG